MSILRIELALIDQIFPDSAGWIKKVVHPSQLDVRPTVLGDRQRCIDNAYGMTAQGYDPDLVPKGPAFLGGADGYAAFKQGTPEERMAQATKDIEASGYQSANHGDLTYGPRGCKFILAQLEGKLPGLETMTLEERLILSTKFDVHYTEVYRVKNGPVPEIVLNDEPNTTILPQGGLYHPVDIWHPWEVGIDPVKSLWAVRRCGDIMLPEGNKNLLITKY